MVLHVNGWKKNPNQILISTLACWITLCMWHKREKRKTKATTCVCQEGNATSKSLIFPAVSSSVAANCDSEVEEIPMRNDDNPSYGSHRRRAVHFERSGDQHPWVKQNQHQISLN